jgi:hypothetical protein
VVVVVVVVVVLVVVVVVVVVVLFYALVIPPLQLWEGKPNSQAHLHPLLSVFCSPASAQGQSGAPSRLQTATQYTRRTAEGHQVGDSKGDLGPIQAGQGLPLPA